MVWVSGVGIERRLGARSTFRAEARYSIHGREEWITPFDDVGVTVLSGMEASEMALNIGVVRWF